MARTMARFTRATTPHTGWCTADHRCGVNLHQAEDIIADGPLGARAVVTRVRAAEVDYADIRIRVPLRHSESIARRQLDTALSAIRALLAAVAAVRPAPLPGAVGRPSIGRRTF
ncbi:hypothetical protein J2S43_006824 [Catenuloplanes nepalensis]|uniref:Uncharacterized protein n=1 Tax=Catenuloplanes nepalensis TaxID=587533 RepID=A0ABT9N3M9_9ACTN|nr:hypothetical protein [Catenuloplanes nepalensis]MDP9798312.1 hypothetical protein [Catenuloplanes nepalensis]